MAIALAVVLGIAWNAVAWWLLGGGPNAAWIPSGVLAGAVAGFAGGRFTVWTRRRQGGRERLRDGFATFYLVLLVHWAAFVVFERVALCVRHGGWTDFDLRDHLLMIEWLGLIGTIRFGAVLIPLTFAARHAIWKLEIR
ncbi:MAG TPA: hypothetical protein VLV15_04385 [Dongiaceae bacterium]|nr:hypothetical protein [Dongiaceae bacterium]